MAGRVTNRCPGMDPVAVTEAGAGDEAEIVALWIACGLVVSTNDPAADFRFALRGACSDVLVARGRSGIVASVMVGHDGHRGWIYYLAVAPEVRRSGLGRRMVEAAEAWMSERQVPKAQLMIRETTLEVQNFYERLGYTILPRVTMQKRLDDAPCLLPSDRPTPTHLP